MPLPKFKNPPVVETVLGVQFDEIEGLLTPHLGLLWHKYRSNLPLIEEHPLLGPAIEKFDVQPPSPIEIAFEPKPESRAWFLNRPRSELIQVQRDRFIRNWRKVADVSYPNYEPLRKQFEQDFALFQEFIETEKLGSINVNQCEVTYVNHIEPAIGVWESHSQIDKILRNWTCWAGSDKFLPVPEDASIRLRFRIPDASGRPIGRLQAELRSARKLTDGAAIFVLNLTARGRPTGSDVDAVLDFLDLGREWVVRGFTELTTTEMHNIWERF